MTCQAFPFKRKLYIVVGILYKSRWFCEFIMQTSLLHARFTEPPAALDEFLGVSPLLLLFDQLLYMEGM